MNQKQTLFKYLSSRKSTRAATNAKELIEKQSAMTTRSGKTNRRKTSVETRTPSPMKTTKKVKKQMDTQTDKQQQIIANEDITIPFHVEDPCSKLGSYPSIPNLSTTQISNQSKCKESESNEDKMEEIIVNQDNVSAKKQAKRNQRSRSRSSNSKKSPQKNLKNKKLPAHILKELQIAQQELKDGQKTPQKTQLQQKTESILSKPSIKERYEELTLDQTQLILPPLYKDLLNFFGMIDQTLEFFVEKGRIGYLDQLGEDVDRIYKKRFNIKDLQRILFLNNDMYTLEYRFNEKKRKQQLCLSFPQERQIDLNQRKQDLRNSLIQYTKRQHYKFLQENNNEDFILRVQKTWHQSFDLNRVEEVPLRNLPDLPNETRVLSVSNQLTVNENNSNLIKDSIVQNIMINMAHKKEGRQTKKEQLLKEAENIKIQEGENNLGVSDSLFKMIQAKRKLQEEKKKQAEISLEQTHESKIPQLKKIIGILTVYYKIRRVTSMALVQVIDQVKLSEDFQRMSNVEIEELIKTLTSYAPELLSIKVNKAIGECLIFNSNCSIKEVNIKLDNMQ